jgi:hypothetical protein
MLNMSDNVKVSSGKGFKFITNFVIHETSHQKITLDFKYVPKPDGSYHHTDLEIIKLSKKPSQNWEEAVKTKIILSDKKPGQSLIKLINAIKAQKDLYKKTHGEVVMLSPEKANIFKQIGDENIDFITRILQSFQSEEAKQTLLEIDEGEIKNLFTTIKHAKNKQAVIQLRKLIGDKVVEQKFQEWIEKNTWVFGTEYIKKFDTRKIGIHSEADFIVESLDGFTDLVELKRADFKLFEHDSSRDCYYPSQHLSQVIGQAIHYIKVMEDHKAILKEQDELEVLKPRVKVVIGRSNNLNTNEKKALRLLNASLHGIEIITFDEILTRAEKIISIYES